jgi:flagellar biosynthesis/type III secretory pathway M-ring protein FliF/YscJ
MQFLKNLYAQAKAFLSQLSPTAAWLIGCLLIIFLLVGWVLLQYAGRSDLYPITQFAAERQPEVIARLQGAGIEVVTENGQLFVPAEKYNDAMVVLLNSDLMPADTTGAFDELIKHQSPWQSNAQNAQVFLLAKQKVLGQIIGKMAGVRSASVMLSMPERQGFGATHVRPSASVNVVMEGQKRVEKRLVEAIAGLVSGAVAEMTPQDVVVVDANRGQQFTVRDAEDVVPEEAFELVHQLEQRYREKIGEVLGYIPGVIVAVNVRVDPVVSRQVEEFSYEPTEPLRSEFTRETERTERSDGGEAGVRPNTGLEIVTSGGAGSSEKTTEARNEYSEKNLTRRSNTKEIGHTTKRINVTINVPRSYFVGVYRQGKPADAPEPDDAALKEVVDGQLAQIQAQVQPLISTDVEEGVVRAHMIPDREQLLAAVGLVTAEAPPGGLELVFGTRWAKPVGLGLLAVLSLAIMFGMVRKATQQPEMPSVEELAGIPPKLPAEDDLVGEAEESDAGLAGLELDEEEVRIRKVAEQIGAMVKSKPMEAGQLFGRWVNEGP